MSSIVPDFKTTLTDAPQEKFLEFKQECEFIASNLFNDFHPDGLRATGATMTDDDWTSYCNHQELLLGNQPLLFLPPRKIPIKPMIFAGNASNATVAIYNDENNTFINFYKSITAYKLKLMDAVGPLIMNAIKDPLTGWLKVTCIDIMHYVTLNYGTMSASVFQKLKLGLKEIFFSNDMTTLLAEINQLTLKFEILAAHGQPLSNLDKTQTVITAIQDIQGMPSLIQHFNVSHPTVISQSHQNLIKFITTHYHIFIIPTQSTSMYSSTFSTKTKIGLGKQLSQETKDFKTLDSSKSRNVFCYFHGWNTSHTGLECFVMKKKGNLNKNTGKPFTKTEIEAKGKH
jgi:hypothetical protein